MDTLKYSIGNSTFGLHEYPSKTNEWTMQKKFEMTAQKGYTHFEGDFGQTDRRLVKQWAKDLGLTLGCLRFGIRSISEMSQLIAEAEEVDASYIVSIAGKAFYPVQQSVDLVGSFMEMSASAGLPFYLETHRDSVTQDLLRCTEILKELPSLSLILDLSHVLVAGEITEDLYEDSMYLLMPLFERTVGFHGRISNGNQIQIGIEGTDDYAAQRFSLLWINAIREWKKKNDAVHPFRFTLELGPPPYALTSLAKDGRTEEILDRVQQGDLLVDLFKQAWLKTE